MATGAPGTNGVWQYGEDDSEATFSALLNKVASTADTQIGTDRGRLTTLEARKLSGLVPIIPTLSNTGGSASINSTTGTITASGVTNLILNNCFSSDYRFYKIVISLTAGGTATLQGRVRNSGGVSTTSYAGRYIAMSNGVFGTAGTTTSFDLTGYTAADTMSAEIMNPYAASMTTMTVFATEGTTSYIGMGTHNVSTSYTSFDVFKGNGEAFSGIINIYGMKA